MLLFSILFQMSLYCLSQPPNNRDGRVRRLPHLGHFWGTDKEVAQYSMSDAIKRLPHLVHLKRAIPRNMVLKILKIYGSIYYLHLIVAKRIGL